MEQVEALMMWLIVDDVMTKLNNLTSGKVVLSSVIFDVGNQDETKTDTTTALTTYEQQTTYEHMLRHYKKST